MKGKRHKGRGLLSGGDDAIMAATILLIPQVMALRLMLRSMKFKRV